MKTIFAFILLIMFTLGPVYGQKINWVSMEEAQELIKKEPRKIIMDAYTNWCGPCKLLDKNTFGNPDVAQYINENYYAVKFNAEGDSVLKFKDNTYTNPNYDPAKANRRNAQHEFARYLGIRAYPTMVFFDSELNVLAPISGYLKPKQIEIYLKLFHTNAYKEINNKEDWSRYQEGFENKFEG
jgi:thioredoxin-related protein